MTGGGLPRVSFIVYAFDQEATVREACLAALAQDYPALEVIFSDDASRDRTAAVMEEVASGYRGPHQVRLNRNARNLGVIGHVNRSVELSTGELIVGAAGDDVSLPLRTRRLVDAYLASGRTAHSIHSAVTAIDADGRELGRLVPPVLRLPGEVDRLALRDGLVFGAAHAFTRRTFEVFGPIEAADAYEDLVIAFRSLLLGPLAYVDEPLVRYRVAGGLNEAVRRGRTRRAVWTARNRMRLATFTQRRADYARIGRPAPRALGRAVELEALWGAMLRGEARAAAGRLGVRPSLLAWSALALVRGAAGRVLATLRPPRH